MNAAIELMPVDPPLPLLALPDVDGTQEFWGVKYIDPEGERAFKPELPKARPSGGVNPMVADATTHVLKAGQPYRREIDLSTLINLDKPRVYHVQLTFNGSAAFKRTGTEWTGFIAGEQFTVEITP